MDTLQDTTTTTIPTPNEQNEQVLVCMHKNQFHNQCINQWLNKNNSCPICRMQTSKNISNNIFSRAFSIVYFFYTFYVLMYVFILVYLQVFIAIFFIFLFRRNT